MSEKSWKRLKFIIIAASVLAAIKLIFVDYTMDEEYQIVMSYRRIFGDTLFGTMWEPHQTSSFLCTLLMRPFLAITGSCDWIVVYLRLCTTVIQFLLSSWIYKALCRMTSKQNAFLLSACYFNMVPKLIQIPEFSNLQLWFFTIILLALHGYYNGNRKRRWIVLSGVAMALEVLSYPACLILFPFFCVVLFLMAEPGKRLRDVVLFGGTCALCAVIWFVGIFREVPISDFLQNLKLILQFDATHDLAAVSDAKQQFMIQELLEAIGNVLLCYLIGFCCYFCYRKWKNRRNGELTAFEKPVFAVFVLLAAEGIQLVYWVVLQRGYEKPQIIPLVLLSIVPWIYREVQELHKTIFVGVLGTILVMLGVLYMSDLGISNGLAHAIPGMVFSALLLTKALEMKEKTGKKWVYILLISLSFVLVFGKGFTVKGGRTETNTVLGIRNVVKYGPVKGVFTNYMLGYILNSDYEDFTSYLEPNEKCLIVTTLVDTAGTSPYLFGNYEICHFSIVDPTTYDEKLLTYWEKYPEKKPDVIAIDCWYGQPMVEEDSWIRQYIDHEFGYTETRDGKYMRFYKR